MADDTDVPEGDGPEGAKQEDVRHEGERTDGTPSEDLDAEAGAAVGTETGSEVSDRRRPEPRGTETRSRTGSPQCPVCGSPVERRHCKYVCPNHGVVVDCSDPFAF